MDEGLMLLLFGAVLAASVLVALLASSKGVPSLVAFLGVGMLLGSDGLGGIEFDDAALARKVGVVGLAAILYEGGLSTSWRRLREVVVPAALLSTVGVVVTAVLTGLAAHAVLDLSWLEAVLLGDVVASTQPPSSPRCASPRSGGASRARWRLRPAATTRWRSRSPSG